MTAVEARPARHVAGAPARRRRGGFAAFVGVLGELLITVGVLLGLYVVWQLWWTDVQANREQVEILAEMGWEPPSQEVAVEVRRDEPPVPEPVGFGTDFAQLYVPRWGDDVVIPVAEGVDKRTILDSARAGHYPDTAMPGAVGNFALAGHRMTYGAVFHRVEELQVGDPVVVDVDGTWYVYRVTEMRAVRPDQVEAIAPVPWEPDAEPSERFLTLTTCHPIGLNSLQERFIVNAQLDYWVPEGAGTPPDLLGQAPPPPAAGDVIGVSTTEGGA